MYDKYYCYECEVTLEGSECEEDDEGYMYCQYCGGQVDYVREPSEPDPYDHDTLEEAWL